MATNVQHRITPSTGGIATASPSYLAIDSLAKFLEILSNVRNSYTRILHRCLARTPHVTQVAFDDVKGNCQDSMCVIKFHNAPWRPPSVSVRLQHLEHVSGPKELRRNTTIQVMKPVSNTLRDGKLETCQSSEYVASIVRTLSEGAATVSACEAFDLSHYPIVPGRNLSRDLDQHEQAFRFVPVALSLKIYSRDLDSGLACLISCAPQIECHDSEKDRRQNSQQGNCHCNQRNPSTSKCSNSCPRVPPNYAILRQRPALAHTLQHAHSLIPLWIGRHSAMRPHARAARPQEASDA